MSVSETLAKKFCFLFFFIGTVAAFGQPTINQITIVPENPTETDTIFVITDMTYQGACNYGIVYNYAWLGNDTIFTIPTYCGYWDTTWCYNRVDTFKIGPYPVGNYVLDITYHQGSVCPISGFDAIIANHDTTITISAATNTSYIGQNEKFSIYPNPSTGLIYIQVPDKSSEDHTLFIYNSLGQVILKQTYNSASQPIDLSKLNGKGSYFVKVSSNRSGEYTVQKVIVR